MRMILTFILLLSFSAVRGQTVPDRLFDQYVSTLAQKLAQWSAQYPELREMVRNETAKRFDGDYNFLLNPQLGFRFADGQTLAQRIAAVDNNGPEVLAFIRSEPRLQIAIPVGFADWNGLQALPVCWVPAAYNEAESTDVPYWSPDGRSGSLPLATAPTSPVWVLSINERTDVDGKLIPGLRQAPQQPWDDDDDRGDGGGGGDDGSGGGGSGGEDPCYGPDGGWQYLGAAYVENMNAIEHWIAGAPEIQFIFKRLNNTSLVNGEWGTIIIPPNRSDINEQWYTTNATLFRWYLDEGSGPAGVGFSCMVFVNEKDNGTVIDMPISLSLATPDGTTISVDFTVTITDKDEPVGSLPAYFIDCNHFTYNPGTVRFRMFRS